MTIIFFIWSLSEVRIFIFFSNGLRFRKILTYTFIPRSKCIKNYLGSNGKKMGFLINQTWIFSLNSPIMNGLTHGKLLNLSESEFPHLGNEDDI